MAPAEPHLTARDRSARLEQILRERICLLDYPPGAKLSEEALAGEFGMSRTPLRRVLARLEATGLLQSVHGVGTFVTDVADAELDRIYALRIELAMLAARLDPRPPAPPLLARFREIATRARALPAGPDTPRAFARLILDFSAAQSELSGNQPLMEMTGHLHGQTARIWLHALTQPEDGPRLDLAEEIAIFAREAEDVRDALEIPDLEAAAAIHRAHVSMSFRRLQERRAQGRAD